LIENISVDRERTASRESYRRQPKKSIGSLTNVSKGKKEEVRKEERMRGYVVESELQRLEREMLFGSQIKV